MVDCPNCRAVMTTRSVEAHGAVVQPMDIDCCAACSLFWFDAAEGMRLTPKAVLELFQYIGQAGVARNPLRANFLCPRCTSSLAFTHDLQRSTRFTYWRCANDRGQLITFHQFLAAKNFIRPPSPDELARLRDTVRQISCSRCGAPVDLATQSACPHCGAPIAVIDSESVAKALQELAATSPSVTTAPATARTVLSDAQVDALFDMERMRERGDNHDLVAIGAAALGAVIEGWLLSR
jgi:hypothetical protein